MLDRIRNAFRNGADLPAHDQAMIDAGYEPLDLDTITLDEFEPIHHLTAPDPDQYREQAVREIQSHEQLLEQINAEIARLRGEAAKTRKIIAGFKSFMKGVNQKEPGE